ncbi:DUF998 domain-containing protein [Streptosporangium carneum]|uniref:DUF998 domain-containing protein n=1 Tax=Streptosporangium carneum TaxID=47481 RepID=A0A9W6MFE7_9ACTN|nr:DUF998 domain-containing protein [Streptosporangium carneum]GLK12564.1 hypothetical protein GCM10017600_59740 [Streptosporangium carneum]
MSTRALLACGGVAGPLFVLVVMIQDYTRPGFDPRRHALSLLSLDDPGWIQIANFAVTGLLYVACAVGLRRALRPGRADTWGPLFIGAFGAGLVGAGVFRTAPGWGYPQGAPPGLPVETSLSYVLHGVSFLVVLLSLIGACFVFARGFAARGERGWAISCAVTGVALPVIYVLSGVLSGGGTDPRPFSLLLRALALVGWSWASLVAVRVMSIAAPAH